MKSKLTQNKRTQTMDAKKSKKAKKKSKKAGPVDHTDRFVGLEARVAALEGIVRKQNPTELPPEDPPAQVRNEVPA